MRQYKVVIDVAGSEEGIYAFTYYISQQVSNFLVLINASISIY